MTKQVARIALDNITRNTHPKTKIGVVPVSSIVPSVGHFNTMLEVARAAKTNKKNAEIGDLGQRLRLAWKQACLIDQRSGAFVASKV